VTTAVGIVVGGLLGAVAGPFLARTAQRSLLTSGVGIPTAVVTVTTVSIAVALGARYSDNWVLPAYLALGATLVVVTAVDLAELRIPNRILYPGGALVAALLVVASLAEDAGDALLRGVVIALVAVAAFLALHVASPRGLGMGDVKLAALLGLAVGWLSWSAALVAVFAAFASGAVVAFVLLAARRVDRRAPLPFGPFLAAGALGALLIA
jgi:leader peptidase (prepilin peptidase) / N-methyltransferase